MSEKIGLLGNNTKLVIEALYKVQIGESISYAEILKILGKDKIDSQVRSAISSARVQLIKEFHAVFDVDRGFGLMRLSNEQIVKLGAGGIQQIRNSTARIVHKLVAVDYAKLDNNAKVEHNTYLSVFGALSVMTQESKIKAVSGAVKEAQAQISIGNTLDVFK